MRLARLGTGGPEIARVGFGAWAAGGTWEFGWGPQEDVDSIAAIRSAIDAGVNWIDTAATYGHGHSEEVVGRAIEPYRAGEDVLVFTKCGRVRRPEGLTFDLTPESIRRECDDSLARLRVERIDLYQFHWPDTATDTSVEESWGAMAELVDEGKVRWAGVSNFPVELLERCEAIRHVDSLQPPLSLLVRGALDEAIPWCADHGTGVIVYAPMASGLLTGRFDRARLDSLAADDWRRRGPLFQEPQFTRALELVDRLRPIADELRVSLPELSVAWTLAQRGVTAAIVGARSPEQVAGWLPAASAELPPDALAAIDEALAETGAGIAELPRPSSPAR